MVEKIDSINKVKKSKKTWMMFGVLALLMFTGSAFAGSNVFNIPLNWVLKNDGSSVDANFNDIIDEAETLNGLTASDVLSAATTSSGSSTGELACSPTGGDNSDEAVCCGLVGNNMHCVGFDSSAFRDTHDYAFPVDSSSESSVTNVQYEFTLTGTECDARPCRADTTTANKICSQMGLGQHVSYTIGVSANSIKYWSGNVWGTDNAIQISKLTCEKSPPSTVQSFTLTGTECDGRPCRADLNTGNKICGDKSGFSKFKSYTIGSSANSIKYWTGSAWGTDNARQISIISCY